MNGESRSEAQRKVNCVVIRHLLPRQIGSRAGAVACELLNSNRRNERVGPQRSHRSGGFEAFEAAAASNPLLARPSISTPSWWADFKAFVTKGSVIDLGVGLVLGAAFGTITSSFVNDLLTPPIGLLLGGVNLNNYFYVLKDGRTKHATYYTPEEAQADGAVTENVGRFCQSVLNFIVIAFALFWLVRGASNMRRKNVEDKVRTTKDCPECCSEINIRAKRCPCCTAEMHVA